VSSARFPRLFGKYVLLRPFARGGMGELFIAASGELGGAEKLCIVKKVPEDRDSPGLTARLLDEARVAVRLNHTNLVQVFDCGRVEDELYIAMELIEGRDLRAVWNRTAERRSRIPLDVALYVVREVARGLEYAHGYGGLNLVHRDIAPPNVLLSWHGEVKLTDFGLARSTLKNERTAPGIVYGRVAYLAPEQARGEQADPRTDIYATGIILWELLTGRPLHDTTDDAVKNLERARHPRIDPPSSITRGLPGSIDQVVLKALATDRNQRFKSAGEFRQAIADELARVAPGTDGSRLSSFLRDLFNDDIKKEQAERDRLLSVELPRLRAERRPARPTPPENVLTPPPAAPPGSSGASSSSLSASLSIEDSTELSVSAPIAQPSRNRTNTDPSAPIEDALLAPPAPRRPATAPPSALPPPARPAPRAVGPTKPMSAMGAAASSGKALDTKGAAQEAQLRAKIARDAAAKRDEHGDDDLTMMRPPRGPSVAGTAVRPGAASRAAAAAEPEVEELDPDVEPELANLVGELIDGRYQVERLLGTGGMGAVYTAEHVDIGKRVALKVLHPQYSRQADLVARFRREARAASKVGHPNIIDVTDSGTTDNGDVYFVMELLDGLDLGEVLRHERRVAPDRTVHIGTQICRALSAAHAAGIIHRDLKPENIFLCSRDGNADFVKVLDFGIAKQDMGNQNHPRRLTTPGIAMGTPEYMAPEQAAGKAIDGRVDIYSVGAILYEMLTGDPPHAGANIMEVLSKKANEKPRPVREVNPNVPEALEQVVMRCLERNPDDRPQTMGALEYELTKSLKGRGSAVAAVLGLKAPPAESDPSSPVHWSSQVTVAAGGAGASGSDETGRAPTVKRPTGPALFTPADVSTGTTGARPAVGNQTGAQPLEASDDGQVRVAAPKAPSLAATGPSAAQPGKRGRGGMIAAAVVVLGLGAGGVWAWQTQAWKRFGIGGETVAAGDPPKGGEPTAVAKTEPVIDPVAPTPTTAPTTAPTEPSGTGTGSGSGTGATPTVAPTPSPAPSGEAPGAANVEHLLEWAKSAAGGGRIVAPPGDNLKELLERIEHADPGNKDAIALRDKTIAGLQKRAALAQKKNQLDLAVTQLEGLLALKPEDAKAKTNYARALRLRAEQRLAKKKVAGALADVTAALELTPDDTPTRVLLAEIYLAKGQPEQAADEYQRILDGKPSDKRARKGLLAANAAVKRAAAAAAAAAKKKKH